MMSDPAEIRADGRRLLADLAAARETIDGDRVEDAKEAWVNFTYQHHDVLLGRPPQGADPMMTNTCARCGRIYDPEKLHGDHDEDRCPQCARPPRVCSHGIYHHGCPSCDRQDPEVSP